MQQDYNFIYNLLKQIHIIKNSDVCYYCGLWIEEKWVRKYQAWAKTWYLCLHWSTSLYAVQEHSGTLKGINTNEELKTREGKGPCWEVGYVGAALRCIWWWTVRTRKMSAQTFNASLFKPMGMMAEPKAQGKQRILDQPTFFFFHFLPSKTINWEGGWLETKYFVFGLFSSSLF